MQAYSITIMLRFLYYWQIKDLFFIYIIIYCTCREIVLSAGRFVGTYYIFCVAATFSRLTVKGSSIQPQIGLLSVDLHRIDGLSNENVLGPFHLYSLGIAFQWEGHSTSLSQFLLRIMGALIICRETAQNQNQNQNMKRLKNKLTILLVKF